MFENANPVDRKRLVSDDYSQARIGFNSVNVGSIEALEILETIQSFIDQQFAPLRYSMQPLMRLVYGPKSRAISAQLISFAVLTKDFLHSTLALKYNFYYHIQNQNSFHNFQATYDLTDAIEIQARYTLLNVIDTGSPMWAYKDKGISKCFFPDWNFLFIRRSTQKNIQKLKYILIPAGAKETNCESITRFAFYYPKSLKPVLH